MQKYIVLACLLLTPLSPATCQVPPGRDGVPVEVVATASEYVPRSTTVSHPGHAYTDCTGSTEYFGQFSSYGSSGSISGTAETDTHCTTTWQPPATSTVTTFRQYNYTILKSKSALYLLACNPRTNAQGISQVLGAIAAGGGGSSAQSQSTVEPDYHSQKCVQSFGIGAKYLLMVAKSYALLDDASGRKPIKLDYVSSAALPAQTPQPAITPAQTQPVTPSREAMVHVSSTPSGCEIYIDGKFFGNTPSDITLPAGDHAVKITIGHKEWSRTLQITAGEIKIHADLL